MAEAVLMERRKGLLHVLRPTEIAGGSANRKENVETFLQHRPYKSRGVFLDVSPYVSTRGRVLAPETWCHAVSVWALT